MIKYQNKYRITSMRVQWRDYSWNGSYFITICTQHREHYFGGIINDQFPFVKLGKFVIMPNHVHGILTIDKQSITETRLIVSPQKNGSPQPIGGFAGEKNPMFHQNISRIIRWYKGRCSFEIRKIHTNFQWQSRYHDHIIRNHSKQSSKLDKRYIIKAA